MLKRSYQWVWVLVVPVLLIFSLNFLNIYLARSTTETSHSLDTYRAGERLPDTMTPLVTLTYAVRGEDDLATALEEALAVALETAPAVGTATAVSEDAPRAQAAPFLLIDLTPERLWTPIYGKATLKAQFYFASDGSLPRPLDEEVVLHDAPSIRANGEFTLIDSTWGIISKPAYNEHLVQPLADAIVTALQTDVFENP